MWDSLHRIRPLFSNDLTEVRPPSDRGNSKPSKKISRGLMKFFADSISSFLTGPVESTFSVNLSLKTATTSTIADSTALACSHISRLKHASTTSLASLWLSFTRTISLSILFTKYSSSYTEPFFPRAFLRSSRLRPLDVRRVAFVASVPLSRVDLVLPPYLVKSEGFRLLDVGAREILSARSLPCTFGTSPV